MEPEIDIEEVRDLANETNLPMPLVAVLMNRQVNTADAIEGFLHPRLSNLSDPFLVPNMDRAVVRIWDAIDAGESIAVFGDYDVDGISSTALLVGFLSELGAPAIPFLPNRIADGYGFSAETVTRCIDEVRPRLIVTVDCGVGSVEGVKAAIDRGVDVVVTDHHEPPKELAPALAIVNPKLSENESIRMLAGVGVAFKLCHALLKVARDQGREEVGNIDLREFMDFVALGTVADIVPLIGENRVLARYGLRRLTSPRSLGLKTLIEVAGIQNEVQAHHVGFQLGPRLNAAGRLGDAEAALELLLTEDEARARRLAMKLDAANRERQDIETRIARAAQASIDEWYKADRHYSLVVAKQGWHPGVIGIVASRLSQRYSRPAIVIGFNDEGVGRGSCRSVEGFDLVENLDLCTEYLIQHGGHAMAAGLELEEKDLDAFRRAFNEIAREQLKGKDLRPVQRIDGWVHLGEADAWLYDTLQQIRPFGHSNPAPVFGARQVRVVRHRIVGNGHLQMTLASGGVQIEAIAFNMGHRALPDGPMDIAFQLKRNHYQGQESLRLDIQDFRAYEEPEPG